GLADTRRFARAGASNTSTATGGSPKQTIDDGRQRTDGTARCLSSALARGLQFQAPKRLSKPPEGIVGAAPLSSPVAFPVSFCGSASCFDGEGLVAAAFAVLVSAGGGSDFARAVPAALCPRFAAGAGGFRFRRGGVGGLSRARSCALVVGLGAEQIAEEAADSARASRHRRGDLHRRTRRVSGL